MKWNVTCIPRLPMSYLRRSLHQMNALTFCDKATNIRVLDVNPFRKESVMRYWIGEQAVLRSICSHGGKPAPPNENLYAHPFCVADILPARSYLFVLFGLFASFVLKFLSLKTVRMCPVFSFFGYVNIRLTRCKTIRMFLIQEIHCIVNRVPN